MAIRGLRQCVCTHTRTHTHTHTQREREREREREVVIIPVSYQYRLHKSRFSGKTCFIDSQIFSVNTMRISIGFNTSVSRNFLSSVNKSVTQI